MEERYRQSRNYVNRHESIYFRAWIVIPIMPFKLFINAKTIVFPPVLLHGKKWCILQPMMPYNHHQPDDNCQCQLLSHVPTLCDTMDCSPPSSSVHGILQLRILGQVAISFSRGIFQTQGLNLDLLPCRQSLPWGYQGSSGNLH